jgi:hypothetical protein
MGSVFMAIVTQEHGIGMEQLSLLSKKIRFLCGALVARAGKLSGEASKLAGSIHCQSGESKSISNWTSLVFFVVCAALSGRSSSALRMRVLPIQNLLKDMSWSCLVT